MHGSESTLFTQVCRSVERASPVAAGNKFSLPSETDLLLAALQPLPLAVATTDVHGMIRSVNAALTSLTGYSAEEAQGQPLAMLSIGPSEHGFEDALQAAIRSRESWRGERICRRKNGDSFAVEQTITPLQNSDGGIHYVVVTLRDIAGPKQVEEDLRLTRERLEAAEQTAGAGTWVWDAATGRIEGSSEWLKLHGLDPQGTLNWVAYGDILHPEDRARVISWLEESLGNRVPNLSTEYRVLLPDGKTRWISASGRGAYDAAGRPVRMTGVCLDITERKRADLFATESRRDFERFFNLIPDLACIVSTDGYFKKVNPAWETTLGYTEEEVLSTPMLEFIHPDDLERTVNEVAKQSREHRTKHFVNRYRCKNGSYRLFNWATTFNRDDSTRFGVARDITEQRLSEESLRESEERFRIMADSCPTIIWVTDAEGRTRLANRMCHELFGATFEQADGDWSRSLIHPDDHPEYVRKFLFAVRERAPFRAEARVRRSDGEWRWIGSYAEPRVSLSGDFLGHVGISPDITDRKQSEEALQRAKDAAEGANRSKSEFLANMSHEIRTPMNGVIGLTELALDTHLTPEQRGYLESVKISADSLLRILNDILDFSKIEAGKLEFEVIEFDLRQAVDAMLKVLGIRAASKKLELACDLGPDVPSKVLGDPGRLQQILVNLTGNAIKFTERGEVVVRVERSSETAGEVELHFSVRDTGIGIPLDKQQHVFRAFAQADSSSTRTFGGTGLGLTISSQLVEMMGGRIWVESEPGAGSTFHFTVRFGLTSQVAVSGAAGPAVPPGLRALIVDDNATNRRILGDVLTRWGVQAITAENARAALDILTSERSLDKAFPLILLDAQMPEEDGFWLAEQITGRPGLAGATIMMVSSSDMHSDAIRCRDLGIDLYLVKPVIESELGEAILQALGRLPKPDLLRLACATGVVCTSELQPRSGVRVLLAEDNPVNQKVALRILEKRGYSVVVAGDGLAAIEEFRKHSFDLALMDIQMPRMDGLEATAAIREIEKQTGGHLPIIALTAHAMKGDRERFIQLGLNDHVSKPIQPLDLFRKMDELLRVPADTP